MLKKRGATVVIISHRPNTLGAVDKLLFLRRRHGGDVRPTGRGYRPSEPLPSDRSDDNQNRGRLGVDYNVEHIVSDQRLEAGSRQRSR